MTASRTASDNNRRIHTTLHLRVRACADYRRVTRVRCAEPAGIAATETETRSASVRRRRKAAHAGPLRYPSAHKPRAGDPALGLPPNGSAFTLRALRLPCPGS